MVVLFPEANIPIKYEFFISLSYLLLLKDFITNKNKLILYMKLYLVLFIYILLIFKTQGG